MTIRDAAGTLLFLAALVLFAAIPARAGGVRDEGVIATQPPEAYAGSASCAECHKERYEEWAGSLKARFVRLLKPGEKLPGDWNRSPVREARDRVMLLDGVARKVTFVDTDWKVLPAEYKLRKGKWRMRPEWQGQDFRVRCGPCHLTGCDPSGLRYAELGVACEACHGPGKGHAESGDKADIVVPVRGSGGVPDVCRRCHNDRNSHARPVTNFTGTFHR